jgi:tyrosine-protein kinase Etk/Wzc
LPQLAVILYRRRLSVLVFIISTIVATVIGAYLWPETYEVDATLLVKIGREISPPTTVPGGQSMAFVGKRPEDITSEIEILKSQHLLQKVVDQLGVEFFQRAPVPSTSLMGEGLRLLGVGASRVMELGRVVLDRMGLDRRVSARDRIVLGLQNGLSIEPVRKTDVIEIRLRTGDPRVGAEVVNTLIALYLDQHLAVFTTPKAREFFEKQVEILETKLKAAEDQRRRFKEQHGVTAFEEQRNHLLRQVAELQAQAQTLDAEVEVAESRLPGLRQRLAASAHAPPAQSQDQEITEQETRLESLRARQRGQRRQLADAQSRLRSLDNLETELKRLDRTLGLVEQDYALYAKKREEARINEAMDREKIANVSVISPAIPAPKPIRPRRLLLIVLALVVGPAGGVAMAFLVEYLDPSIRSREDVESHLGLPLLASIPAVKVLGWTERPSG